MRDNIYQAFISYRHTPLSIAAAKAVHARLETFRIPGYIKKKTGLKKPGKCFRDQDELPTSSHLADSIVHALDGSEWLVVICTPELSESKWCMTEIEYFIQTKGRERILAVLADGEPATSFPDILRFETLPDGTRVEREPLAADIRGKNVSQMKKLLKTEKLRLIAPMLGVSFDDLKRRARERFLKAFATVCLAGLIAVTGVGSVIGVQAMTIAQTNDKLLSQMEETNRQREIAEANAAEALRQSEIAQENEARAVVGEAEAKRQAGIALTNEELAKENESLALLNEAEARRQETIARENENRAVVGETEARRQQGIAQENERQARTERDNALAGQSMLLSNQSEQALNKGDRMMATMLAMEGLPKNLQNIERPIVQETVTALRNAVYASAPGQDTAALSRSGAQYAPVSVLQHSSPVINSHFYGDYFITVTKYELCVYNKKNGMKLGSVELDITGATPFVVFDDFGGTHVVYKEKVELYHLKPDATSFEVPHQTIEFPNSFGSVKDAIIVGERVLYLGSNTSYDVNQKPTARDSMYLYDIAGNQENEIVSPKYIDCADISGTRIATGHYGGSSRAPDSIKVWDMRTGSILLEFSAHKNSGVSDVIFSPDGKYILSEARGVVQLFDVNTGKELVNYNDKLVEEDFYANVAKKMEFSPDGTKVAILCAKGILRVYHSLTGEQTAQYENISSFMWYEADSLLCGLTDKTVVVWNARKTAVSPLVTLVSGTTLRQGYTTGTVRIPPSLFISKHKDAIAASLTDNSIQLWHTALDAAQPWQLLAETLDAFLWFSGVSSAGKYIYTTGDTGMVHIFDAKSGKHLWSHRVNDLDNNTIYDNVGTVRWFDDDTRFFANGSFFDVKTGKVLTTPEFTDDEGDVRNMTCPGDGVRIGADPYMLNPTGDLYAMYVPELDMLYVVETYTGSIVYRLTKPAVSRCYDGELKDLKWTWAPDGKRIIGYSTASGTVFVCDVINDNIWKLTGNSTTPIYELSAHPSMPLLAIFYNDSALRIWDIDAGVRIDEIFHKVSSTRTGLSRAKWSEDGKNLAFRGTANKVWIYSLNNRKIIQKLNISNNIVLEDYQFSFSPDGRLIAVNEVVYSVTNGNMEYALPYGTVGFSALAWADNDRLVSQYSGSSVCMWRISSLGVLLEEARAQLSGRDFSIEEREYLLW